MPSSTPVAGSDLFIVDNSDEVWKVREYLREWCGISQSIDIATGYFEIGSLLALDGEWQKVDRIRVLMGDEVSLRTKKAFVAALSGVSTRLDGSLEAEKETNDFLEGVPAIVQAIRAKKIECRVYRKEKFHAKAYITHSRIAVVGSSALVGSSNFTFPGLAQNIELNVQITGRQVLPLQEWYEQHWNDAEDVTPEILRVIERHVAEYSPFEVYAKSLFEYFRGHEVTASEWERDSSRIYRILAPYQREGYRALLKKAGHYRGAFLCDGVGLGKTFIGLMLIERFVMHDRLNVALFVPKSARESVWERNIETRLKHLTGKFTHLAIFSHTDLLRECMAKDLESVRERADVIIVDEAHHFRNQGRRGEEDETLSRYWKLAQIAQGKRLILLTATPVNNRLLDLQHMIELFTGGKPDYFRDAPLGIHSLPGHFRKMENALDALVRGETSPAQPDFFLPETNLSEAELILSNDTLFRELVVQRSRAYVKRSCQQEDAGQILFPTRLPPQVVPYSVKKTYGELLKKVEKAFSRSKSLFSLAIYDPYAYWKGPEPTPDDKEFKDFKWTAGRQKQVVALIRIAFLKRFESSVEAFRMSCWRLLKKLLAWVEVHAETGHEKQTLERWKLQYGELIHYVHAHQKDLFGEDEEDADEDILPEEMLEAIERLDREKFKVDDIFHETMDDLRQVAEFLQDMESLTPVQDNKLAALKKLLKSDKVLRDNKVLVFTEFMDTARYLRKELVKDGIRGVAEVDSATKEDRSALITRFCPYYNGSSSHELKKAGQEEIRVLVSTDVLSEGLNLQDATRLINYDLHWNPVRLMQRIGRVDRRMDPEVEARLVADHPKQQALRGEVAFWNFLPPDELDGLLRLYQAVSRKTLKISKTFGIEGRQLLTPADDYDALRDFTEAYEGTLTPDERLHLELQQMLKRDPSLETRLQGLPGRVFSGRRHPWPGTRAVFFCYALPVARLVAGSEGEETTWSAEAGITKWYLFDLATQRIEEDALPIADVVRSLPETPRECAIPRPTLAEIRRAVERHIKNSYLKRVQAPIGADPALKAWMELNA
jgi:superfamily II DNA or RNA helicase